MNKSEEIQKIRDLQRESARSNQALSYKDAKQRVLMAQRPDAKEQLIASLKAELTRLRGDVDRIRITGPGFSGEGPRGIMYKPDNANAGGSGSGGTGGATIQFAAVKIEDGPVYTAVILEGTLTEVV